MTIKCTDHALYKYISLIKEQDKICQKFLDEIKNINDKGDYDSQLDIDISTLEDSFSDLAWTLKCITEETKDEDDED